MSIYTESKPTPPPALETEYSGGNLPAPEYTPRTALSELAEAAGLSTVILTIYSSMLTLGELSQDNIEFNIPKLACYSLATLVGAGATTFYAKFR